MSGKHKHKQADTNSESPSAVEINISTCCSTNQNGSNLMYFEYLVAYPLLLFSLFNIIVALTFAQEYDTSHA